MSALPPLYYALKHALMVALVWAAAFGGYRALR
jgi:hypothetical protein